MCDVGSWFSDIGNGIGDFFSGGGEAAGAAGAAAGAGSGALDYGSMLPDFSTSGAALDPTFSAVGDITGGGAGAGLGAAASGITGAASAAPSSSSWFGDATSFLKNNASWLVPAAGMGYAALSGNKTPPAQGQLQSNAKTLTKNATGLMAPLASGAPLPVGAEMGIQENSTGQEAAIRSKFASMGLSGSSMEAQALAQVQQSANTQRFQQAQSLYNQGLSSIGAADTVTSNIMQTQLAQDNAMTSALAKFAAASVPSKNVSLFG